MVRRDLLLSSINKLIDLKLTDREILEKLARIGVKQEEVLGALKEVREKGFKEKEIYGLELVSLSEVEKVIEMKEEIPLPEIKVPEPPSSARTEGIGKRLDLLDAKFKELLNQVKELNEVIRELIESELEEKGA